LRQQFQDVELGFGVGRELILRRFR
jgi:hypothetical protein